MHIGSSMLQIRMLSPAGKRHASGDWEPYAAYTYVGYVNMLHGRRREPLASANEGLLGDQQPSVGVGVSGTPLRKLSSQRGRAGERGAQGRGDRSAPRWFGATSDGEVAWSALEGDSSLLAASHTIASTFSSSMSIAW